MTLPLPIGYTKSAAKYLEALDAPTKRRIKEKIAEVASNPEDPRCSYPLTNSDKRSSRVGSYRILMLVKEDLLLVSDIDSRGQIYRNA
jgi:mRNA-degrading endonuclease RelE of RelBE toxin-antitoxin system